MGKDLVTKVAEVMCRHFYWGQHIAAKDREVRKCASEIVALMGIDVEVKVDYGPGEQRWKTPEELFEEWWAEEGKEVHKAIDHEGNKAASRAVFVAGFLLGRKLGFLQA